LIFNKERLKDGEMLHYYKVQDESELELAVEYNGEIELLVLS
jgi:hypothetical protein